MHQISQSPTHAHNDDEHEHEDQNTKRHTFDSEMEEAEYQRLYGSQSRSEVIANFVYPNDEDVETGIKKVTLGPETSKPTVLTLSRIAAATTAAAATVPGSTATTARIKRMKSSDLLVSTLIEKMKIVNQILMDSLIVNREALDILTFPLSHDFEPFSRVKGVFWILSHTARIIKGLDRQTDTGSIIAFATKEIEEFCSLVVQFMIDSLLFIREVRIGLRRVKKLANHLEKELQKWFSLPPCNHTSSLSIYSTEMDTSTITFYEQFQGASFFDYNKTSIELLWTPTLSYFKGFKEHDWYCLQVESPQLQAKILLSFMKLTKKIFLEVKYILEEEVDTIDTHFNSTAAEIQKILRDLKSVQKGGGGGGGLASGSGILGRKQQQRTSSGSASGTDAVAIDAESPQITDLHQQLQIIYDLHNTLDNFQIEFETGFKWIQTVLEDVAQMAALRPEDMDDFQERQNEKGPLFCSIFAKCKCKQKLDPFLQSPFRYMLLRVPLQNDVFKLLQGLKNKPPWNGQVHSILKIIGGAQVSQFQEKQVQEGSDVDVNKESQEHGQTTSPNTGPIMDEHPAHMEHPPIPLTVYNIGHVFVEIKE